MDTDQLLSVARKVWPFLIAVPVLIVQSGADNLRAVAIPLVFIAISVGIAVVKSRPKISGRFGGSQYDRSGSPLRNSHVDDIMSTHRSDSGS